MSSSQERKSAGDPLIDDVRERRRQAFEQAGGTSASYFARLKEIEAENPEKVVAPPRQPRAERDAARAGEVPD